MPHVPCDYIMGIFLFKAVVCQGGLDFIVQLTQFMKRKTLPRAGNPAASRSVCAQRSSSMLLPTRDKLAMLADALQRCSAERRDRLR